MTQSLKRSKRSYSHVLLSLSDVERNEDILVRLYPTEERAYESLYFVLCCQYPKFLVVILRFKMNMDIFELCI